MDSMLKMMSNMGGEAGGGMPGMTPAEMKSL